MVLQNSAVKVDEAAKDVRAKLNMLLMLHFTCFRRRQKVVKLLQSSPVQVLLCLAVLLDAGIVIAQILLDLHAVKGMYFSSYYVIVTIPLQLELHTVIRMYCSQCPVPLVWCYSTYAPPVYEVYFSVEYNSDRPTCRLSCVFHRNASLGHNSETIRPARRQSFCSVPKCFPYCRK